MGLVVSETITDWYSDNGIFTYVEKAVQIFSQPIGLLLLLFVLMVAAYILFSRLGTWLAWTLLIFLGIQGRFNSKYYDMTLIAPFEQMRDASRVVFVGLLVTLTIKLAFLRKQQRNLRIPAAAVLLLVLHILYAIRWVLSGDVYRGIGNPIVISMMVCSVTLLWRRYYRDVTNIQQTLTCMQFAGIAFALVSFVQYLIRPSAVILGGRFTGISGNPNFAGFFCACIILPSVYLCMSYNRPKLWRIWDISCVIVLSVVLLWSGSRTAALLAIIGIGWMLRLRLKAWAFVIPLVVIAIYLFVGLYDSAEPLLSRFTSADSSGRFELWEERWQAFCNDPLFGSMPEAVENSYLYVAGSTGIVGLVVLAFAGIIHFYNVCFLWRHRSILGTSSNIADLMLAWSVAWVLAAGAEGFVLGVATASVVFQFFLITFASVLVDDIKCRESQAGLLAGMYEGGYVTPT